MDRLVFHFATSVDQPTPVHRHAISIKELSFGLFILEYTTISHLI